MMRNAPYEIHPPMAGRLAANAANELRNEVT